MSTAWASDVKTGCNCGVRIEGGRISWCFNSQNPRGGAPIEAWQYEADLSQLAKELDWPAIYSTTECAMDLLRRYINAGADCAYASALTAREREIEELTLP